MKKFLPHLAAVALFILISAAYFWPAFNNKEMMQHDVKEFNGMSKEISDHRQAYHEEPLWTNAAFSGMPAFQISVKYPSNLIAYVHRAVTLGMPFPANVLFMLLFGFYILMLVMKVDPWLGFLGSVAFAFSSFYFISIGAGHNTKVVALSYLAPTFAGVLLLFRGKYLAGGALMALFLSLMICANHLQITYYLFMLILVYILFEFSSVIRTKAFMPFAKSIAVFGIAALLAVASSAGNIWSTYVYGKSTTRSRSELTDNPKDKTSGLDRSYITNWSYGKGESMSLLIPNVKGGGNRAIGNVSKNATKNVDQRMKQTVASMDAYFGEQPGTAGPTYAGAVTVFLFVLGLFIVEGRMKWFLLAGTIMSISLAWGKNMMWLTNIFLDYFPGYNKFRSVSMILTLAEFTLPFLAVLALERVTRKAGVMKESMKLPLFSKPVTKMRLFYVAFGITAGITLLYYVTPGSLTSFVKNGEDVELFDQIKGGNPTAEDQQVKAYVDEIMVGTEIARKSILQADAGRSLILIILAGGILFFYFRSNFDKRYLFASLAFIIVVDMGSVSWRYLNHDSFVDKKKVENQITPSVADKQILEDKSLDYRVLNMSLSTFNDASTSYFHKSIGGYHGAKLKRYQELIENHIFGSIQAINNTLMSSPTDSAIRIAFSKQPVLNMLNTKYIIYNKDAPPLENRFALGNAWFVRDVTYVADADKEIAALATFDPRNAVVVSEGFKQDLAGFTPAPDPSATISLTEYKANRLVYKTQAAKEQLAVFSEIYYSPGWNAYIDGQITPHFRANYVLRAMRIPAGNHQVEFKFEPTEYASGEKISMASSALLILLVLGAAAMELKKSFASTAEN